MAIKLSQSKSLYTSNTFKPGLQLNELPILAVKCDYDNMYVKFLISTNFKTQSNEDAVSFKNNLLKTVAQIFGQMNILIPLDIMRYDPVTKEVIIRCNTILFQRFTCSLQLNKPHMFNVDINKISYNNPLNLMFNSRSYNHCLKKKNIKQ